MAQTTMYPAQVNSLQTELASAIDDTQTIISVLDASVLPVAPNLLVIGGEEDAETVLYTAVAGDDLTVTRGLQGTPKAWGVGVKVGRFFTAYDHDAFKGNIEDLQEKATEKSTSDTTYYVATTGSDSNDGSSGSPFATIGKAVSVVPQILNHTYTINIAAGTYDEDVLLQGIKGGRDIALRITGSASTDTTRTIKSLIIEGCENIRVQGLYLTKNNDAAIVLASEHITLTNVQIDSAGSVGINFSKSTGHVQDSLISNKGNAVYVGNYCKIFTARLSGSGNTVGLYVFNGGTIHRVDDTYPGATTPWTSNSGGQVIAPSGLQLGTTNADTTLYVDASTGDDSNDGSSGSPLKTIMAAIARIPQIVNHIVTINVAAGTYAETVTIVGFFGSGSILVVGGTSAGTSYTVNNVRVAGCACVVHVKGINANMIFSANGFEASRSSSVTFEACNATASNPNAAFFFQRGFYVVTSSVASNAAVGILARYSVVLSDNNTGSGNTVGLQADSGATLGKSGTQPSGTTAELEATGGVIR